MSNAIIIVFLLFLGISFIVSTVLKSKFTKDSKIPLSKGLSARPKAEKILQKNGIYDVKVTSVNGFLSDQYNPATKTLNLRLDVDNGQSIFGGVAAHVAMRCNHLCSRRSCCQAMIEISKNFNST